MAEALSTQQPRGAVNNSGSGARRRYWLTAALLVVVVFAVYADALRTPFIFDDHPGILHNDSIRDLSALGTVLMPKPLGGSSIDGRPIANLTLAINYAIGGENVFGYHLFNVALHAAVVLVFMGLVWRITKLPRVHGVLASWPATRWPRESLLAGGMAALWGLHPLVTEPVVCVIHRTEELAGLFLLCCCYCLVRLLAEPERRVWVVGCWVSCALGMASKESMAAAPLLLLLIDRALGAGTFGEAWRWRWRLYVALGATWGLLAAAMALSPNRGGTVGFGLGMSPWHYLLTQCWAIAHYLRLAVWPHPLVIDYGDQVITDLGAVWPQGLFLVILAVATLWAIARRPVAGLLGAWFFGLLAPSSSIVPVVTQTIAERRMYLPLIPVVVLVVVAVVRFLPRAGPVLLLALAAALGITTRFRTFDYRTEESIWAAAVARFPENYRNHYNLGMVCDMAGRLEEARGHYAEARRLNPKYGNALVNLGTTLMRLGRLEEGHACFVEALKLVPGSATNEFNVGQACFQLGRIEESIGHLRAAVTRDPKMVEGHERLGGALAAAGRMEEAVAAYREAVRLEPGRTRSWSNLGVSLFQLGRANEAVTAFEAALRTKPGDATIERYLAVARGAAGDR